MNIFEKLKPSAMQNSRPIPQAIAVIKEKKSWIPKINGAKIAKFIKDAYFWEEEHEKPSERTNR